MIRWMCPLLWLAMCLEVAANPLVLTSERLGLPILPATPYIALFGGLPPAAQLVGLSVEVTNGDFNSADETLAVSINDVRLGRPRALSISNQEIEASLLLEFSEEELADHFVGFEPHRRPVEGTIKVTLVPSQRVDQSLGAPFNPSQTATSHFQVTIHVVPEPASWWIGLLGGAGCCGWRRRRGLTVNS